MEIMVDVGAGIERPEEHVGAGMALSWPPTGSLVATIVRIHAGHVAPADTDASVQFKDHWYWIDYMDIASKRTFTFLMLLFSLAETGRRAAVPVVTGPSR
jgi:hypothetical protein